MLKSALPLLAGLAALPAATEAAVHQLHRDAPGECGNSSILQKRALDERYRSGPFTLFYTRSGPDAVPAADDNHNGLPDYVEDTATQLQAADRYYQQQLKLTPPLAQPRYRSAKAIHVYLLHLPKGSGLAFDEVRRTRSGSGERLPCSLTMMLNTAPGMPHGSTPAHELFHLYQYGYMQFKTAWVLEGMTRWVETAFHPVAQRQPGRKARRDAQHAPLFSQRYGAWPHWQQRAVAHWGSVTLSPELAALRYVNGSPVFSADTLRGGLAVKPLLERLQQLSRQQSQQLDLPYYRWPEALQRSPRFDAFICNALRDLPCPQVPD